MIPEDQILEACTAAFFPDVAGRSIIFNLVKNQRLFGAAAIAEIRRVDSHCSEKQARLFWDTSTALRSNFSYWLNGMDKEILSEFPAHRLIRGMDVQEAVAWPTFWLSQGGRDLGGPMVALKWDPVWWKISAFNLPFAPFQLGSGYDLEDVDRSEAESLGFKIPHPPAATVKIELDMEDLRRRIAAQLSLL